MSLRIKKCCTLGAVLLALWIGTSAAAHSACPSSQRRDPHDIAGLTFLGTAELRRKPESLGENLGGISGLDYDPIKNLWYLLSDDRSQRAPARFYQAEITVDRGGFGTIAVLPPVALPIAATEIPDPEALRVIPCTTLMVWSSEGYRAQGLHPSVRLVSTTGEPLGQLSLPDNLKFSADGLSGARENLSIEGLAPTADGKALWVFMEAPLIQDGPKPDLLSGAVVRLTRLPLDGGKAVQYGYPIDPIPVAASGGRHRADNGVSEILAFGDEKILVIERSGREIAPNEFAFDIRIYQASLSQAEDVSQRHSLLESKARTVEKHLILSLKDLGLPWIDNLEGAAWGPKLADGRSTLVLVSDDNFSPNQTTQLMVFAVEVP